jgi:xylulokinase
MAESRRCAIGVDIGAGAMKVSVVDDHGRDLAAVSRAYPTFSPQPGWSEQDPEDWWRALCECVPAVFAAAGIKASDVAAVGFSAGTHSPVLVDAAGNLVRRAILWSDQRSGQEARELQQRSGDEILRTALNWPTPTWTLCQFLWLRRHEPAAVARTARLMMPKDWLRWRLCGEWHTDITDAIGTLMWDHGGARWSARLCELIDWPIETLPPVTAPADVVGRVSDAAAAECGLAPGTPLVCGTSDTSVEAYAAGADVGGAGVVKLATAATVSLVAEAPFVHRTLINYPFAIPGLWYTITATNSCASAHRWLRDNFFMREGDDGAAVFAHMDQLAAGVSPGSDGLLFHPYLLGERAPYWDPLLRGDFLGMTMRHGRAHFVRALYEGIALSLCDVLGAFRAQGLDMRAARIIGGGSRSAAWRQIVADVLDVRVELPTRTDASSGVALLAGVAAGFFADERKAREGGGTTLAVHEPQAANRARYADLYALYRESAGRLRELNHALSAFERRGA